ncbi:uncharacterized protein N7482_007260 [Penicillium canariense]|uniref:Uncharacterized protein n=1 Tax=Penicillium canariense TaxID=189055 RepID=A0A9W9HYR5_9EURO|nr:uncharacterized protein N7482_007260 [Penicillium canariense]KAJ5160256.1 hypothetical protein N7482_007260 [Penicillium canariense]
MCIYTYHHYPVCGHISNWTVTSCKEFTNRLRLLARGGMSGSCNRIRATHDLLSATEADICGQCKYELREAAFYGVRDAFAPKTYQEIEGLSWKTPIIELVTQMNVGVSNGKMEEEEKEEDGASDIFDGDRPDMFAAIAQQHESCECWSCSKSRNIAPGNSDQTTQTSSVSTNHSSLPDSVTDILKHIDRHLSDDSFASPAWNGNPFDVVPITLPSEQDNIADLCKALRQGSSNDISPSSTQVGVRASRHPLCDILPVDMERMSTKSRSWPSFDLSDVSSIDLEGNSPNGYLINQDSSAVLNAEVEGESEVQDPTTLACLGEDEDDDADDESGGCEVSGPWEDEDTDEASTLSSLLEFNEIDLAPVQNRARPVARPATPIPVPYPSRTRKTFSRSRRQSREGSSQVFPARFSSFYPNSLETWDELSTASS